jgi:hypothetical protein
MPSAGPGVNEATIRQACPTHPQLEDWGQSMAQQPKHLNHMPKPQAWAPMARPISHIFKDLQLSVQTDPASVYARNPPSVPCITPTETHA